MSYISTSDLNSDLICSEIREGDEDEDYVSVLPTGRIGYLISAFIMLFSGAFGLRGRPSEPHDQLEQRCGDFHVETMCISVQFDSLSLWFGHLTYANAAPMPNADDDGSVFYRIPRIRSSCRLPG